MFSRPCSTADRRRLLTAATKTTTTTSFHRAATPTNTRQWHHTNDGIISKRRSSLSSRMNGLFVLSLLLVVVLASAPLVTGRPDILPGKQADSSRASFYHAYCTDVRRHKMTCLNRVLQQLKTEFVVIRQTTL